jgi:ankyrin repeat protein
MKYLKLFENFDAEQEMSDILGYDVKLFHKANKLLFLSPEELQEWFEEEMEKDEPNLDLIKILETQHGIEFDFGDKDLCWASLCDFVELAEYLLDRGADKEGGGWSFTPLHCAAMHDSERVAKLLIDAGADKDAEDRDLRTPLHEAAKYDSEAVAKLLIDAGADKDAQDKELRTPLHSAADYFSERVAKLLIDAGADKDIQDDYLQTPLHYAAYLDDEVIVKLLIDAGAKKDLADKNGKIPYDLAKSEELKNLLRP